MMERVAKGLSRIGSDGEVEIARPDCDATFQVSPIVAAIDAPPRANTNTARANSLIGERGCGEVPRRRLATAIPG